MSDYILMGLILSGSVYILYRSLWKKKGHCQGCSTGSCGSGNSRNAVKTDHCS